MLDKKWTSRLIAALLCLTAIPALAAPAQSQGPITLEANYVQYNDETGELKANGNVKVNQENTWINTQEITGNLKTGDIVANGQVTWTEDKDTMTGEQLNYNYKTKEGRMSKANGKMDDVFLKGESAILHPQSSLAYNATVTRCPALVPDYKVTAKKIVIYPGDKLIAYNASFWIKNLKLFTLPKFEKKLTKEESGSTMPSLGYRSRDGFYVKQHLEFPLSDKVAGIADVAYYTEKGLKTQFGFAQTNKDSSLSLLAGDFQGHDDKWYKMMPGLIYKHSSKPIGKNFNYSYLLQAAKIMEDEPDLNMWQEKAMVWVDHNPIKLDARTKLKVGTAFEHDWYSDTDGRSAVYLNTMVNRQVSDKVSAGIGFNYVNENKPSPFQYDHIDVTRGVVTKFDWKVDRLWKVGVETNYDMNASDFHDIDYSVTRNLHCFEAELTYREKRDEWRFRVNTIHW